MGSELVDFGIDTRVRSRLAVAAPVFAAAGVVFAAMRPLGAEDARWTNRAVLLGILAIGCGIAGNYVAGTRGIGGRRAARIAIALGAGAGLFAFFDGAVRDGTFTPGKFAEQYLDWDIIQAVWGDLRRGLVNTVRYAGLAEGVAIVAGLIIATFVLSPRRRFRWPAVWYVDVVRGTPLVVLTALINFGLPYVGVRLDFLVAMTTILAVNASAYVAEIFRAGIQSVPRGQMDAARSLGMPAETAMTAVVLPQAVRSVIPPLVSEFIALIKDTAIVAALLGLVPGNRETFNVARQAVSSTFRPTPYLLAALFYLAVTVPLARSVGVLERRLRAGYA